ncbi:MAG: glycosyltransferase family 39 protein [Bacteroidetes bacterium]|nr:glycosyltransferase family 39 protein [Fibrella sp.]
MPSVPKLYPFILLALGLLFFVPFLGYSPLFDGAELRFAEAAREMLVTNTFSHAQLNFEPDPATPPLLPWLQALSMRLFGVADNAELAARLPSALMGIVTLLTLFYVGRKKHDARFGLLWALSYLGSVTPFILAKSALPATTGHLFNFVGTLYLAEVLSSTDTGQRLRHTGVAGLFFGVALLTNGALNAGFLIILLLLINYWRIEHRPLSIKIKNAVVVLIPPILCSVAWLMSVPGPGWQRALKSTTDFSTIGFLLAGVVGILLTVVLSSRYWSEEKITPFTSPEAAFQHWMATVSRSAIFILVTAPSGVLLFWFLLSYLTTYHIHQILLGKTVWDKINTYLMIISGLLVGLLMIAVPYLGMNPDWLARRTSDPYWVGITEAPVNWGGWEWLIGVALIVSTTFFALRVRQRIFQSMVGLYLATAVCTLAFLTVVVPKIEQYLQGPLVDFCEAKWKQPVYVQTSFPSYAPLFYTRRQPPIEPRSRRMDWLINGPVDRQTFIITTATDASRYRYKTNLDLVSEESGYVIFKRKQFQ